MPIGKPNQKLQWAKQGEKECGKTGYGHFCCLVKDHKGKKHSCSCGREYYLTGENF